MWRKSADDRILAVGPTLNRSQLGGMEQSSGGKSPIFVPSSFSVKNALSLKMNSSEREIPSANRSMKYITYI